MILSVHTCRNRLHPRADARGSRESNSRQLSRPLKPFRQNRYDRLHSVNRPARNRRTPRRTCYHPAEISASFRHALRRDATPIHAVSKQYATASLAPPAIGRPSRMRGFPCVFPPRHLCVPSPGRWPSAASALVSQSNHPPSRFPSRSRFPRRKPCCPAAGAMKPY